MTATDLALKLYNAGHRITNKGKLVNPAKRLVPTEIATEHQTTRGIASQAVHMVAHTIATDEEGESESTSDFLYQVGKQRFGEDWQTAIEATKARYDTGYLPN
jgi:hypothetical protein